MLRVVPFVLGTLLLLSTLPFPAPGMAAPRKPRAAAPVPAKETILLMGQSNMVGKDKVIKDSANTRLKAFLKNAWRSKPQEPLHEVGYGPGVSFGLTLLRNQHAKVVRLVPCAVGSTEMLRWTPPGGDVYRACMAKLKRSKDRVTGVLFYQGETDAGTLANANNWDERFAKMVEGLRGVAKNPNLPVVFAQLATTDRPAPYWTEVKASQASVNLPNVVMIKTEDLPTFDGLHLTAASQRIVGCRFARELAQLRGFSVSNLTC